MAQPKDVKCTAPPPSPLIKHPLPELTQNESSPTLLTVEACFAQPFHGLCPVSFPPCHHDVLESMHLLWIILAHDFKPSLLVHKSNFKTSDNMFRSNSVHHTIWWFTATILRKTGTPEYWGQAVQACPLCFPQSEHLKCLSKETLAFNAIAYFRLTRNVLCVAEFYNSCILTQPPWKRRHFPATRLLLTSLFTFQTPLS